MPWFKLNVLFFILTILYLTIELLYKINHVIKSLSDYTYMLFIFKSFLYPIHIHILLISYTHSFLYIYIFHVHTLLVSRIFIFIFIFRNFKLYIILITFWPAHIQFVCISGQGASKHFSLFCYIVLSRPQFSSSVLQLKSLNWDERIIFIRFWIFRRLL
jgi:hypothetical protein